MTSVLVSFAVGFGVGLIYWALRTPSPAPPIVALVGLLGIVMGERAPAFWTVTVWPALTRLLG